ncbi:hypothetical protein ACFZ9C_19605, partial [Acinetobacter baumannii]
GSSTGAFGAVVSIVTTAVSVPALPAASVAVTVMVCGPPEDLNGDGILNADELGTDGSFNAQVALGPDALDGTVV